MTFAPNSRRRVKMRENRSHPVGAPARVPRRSERDYARVLVEPAPLPPHERPWRHPSEIGPTRAEIERDGQGRPIVLAAGALAAILLVATVVAMTPRPAAGPNAISATTKPALAQAAASPAATGGTQIISASRAPRLASFAPIPNAIAAAPVGRENTVVVAASLPSDGEVVHVTTESVTYRVEWADIAFLELYERALVLNGRGELVARIVDGDIVVLAD